MNPKPKPPLPAADAARTPRALYRSMLRIRRFEEELHRLVGTGAIGGTTHLCAGQEAIAVGVSALLTVEDQVVSTHRGHGHLLAKGARCDLALAEFAGRATGYCRGKGGSQHIAVPALGHLGSNGITGGGLPDGARDGLRPVGQNLVIAVQTRLDRLDDGGRRLVARVVAGNDHLVRQPRGDLTHQRALAGIAIAAASEHAEQPPTRLGAQGVQDFLQRIRRMCVIDDNQRQFSATQLLHAARHRLDLCNGRHGVVQLHAGSEQRSQHRQQVGGIETADHGRRQHGMAGIGPDLHGQTLGRECEVIAAHHRILSKTVSQHRATLGHQFMRDLTAEGIVEVQHTARKPGPVEQPSLGGRIGRHVAVIIQMVAR